ncbi:MAG: hypothetical protein SGJ16_02070 [Nitrospirota bacterium]|nr:hypothetical protein [Nitrospirota bacterium]
MLPAYADFLQNNASSRHALVATLLAYHMYEWVNRSKFTTQGFKRKYPSDTTLADTFDVARKITNGTKHFTSKARTRKQRGFSSAFSDGFARPLVVGLPDGSYQSMDALLRAMIDFWKAQARRGAF